MLVRRLVKGIVPVRPVGRRGGHAHSVVLAVRLLDQRVDDPEGGALREVHDVLRGLLLSAALGEEEEVRDDEEALAVHDSTVLEGQQRRADVLRPLEPTHERVLVVRAGGARGVPRRGEVVDVLRQLRHGVRALPEAPVQQALVLLLRPGGHGLALPLLLVAPVIMVEHELRERELRPELLPPARRDALLEELLQLLQRLQVLGLVPVLPQLGQAQLPQVPLAHAGLELLPRVHLPAVEAVQVLHRVGQLLDVPHVVVLQGLRQRDRAVAFLLGHEVRVVAVEVQGLHVVDRFEHAGSAHLRPDLLQEVAPH
mmetsp:Transcript_107769/g.305404  ORF Transcript_107769/g.305404 Transcript_107769/m.305404 type:complete len:312 (-) Transcript_107769:707-1642(-)